MSLPKLLYFGSPALAVPPLEALIECGQYEVAGVVTQTDKPSGRGNKLSAPPVKECALARSIKIFQPKSLKSFRYDSKLTADEAHTQLADFLNDLGAVDAFIVAAYGKIIPKALIEFPRCGVINIHMSLLPRWRGAAPIQRAILAGDTLTGVSIMQIDEGLDTGPVFAKSEVPIGTDEDSGSLASRLSSAGSELLLATLPKILDGSLKAVSQPDLGVTYAAKLEKSDFRIDWSRSAEEIRNVIRAAAPNPGAAAEFEGEPVKIFRAHEIPAAAVSPGAPGEIVESTKGSVIVATGNQTFLSLEELQFAGKKRLPIAEIAKGREIRTGVRFR